jgi:hypothetical protein
VASVEVESSDLPETVSGTAAAAFGKLHFVPGEIDGQRVRTLMRIEVAYVNGKRPPPWAAVLKFGVRAGIAQLVEQSLRKR